MLLPVLLWEILCEGITLLVVYRPTMASFNKHVPLASDQRLLVRTWYDVAQPALQSYAYRVKTVTDWLICGFAQHYLPPRFAGGKSSLPVQETWWATGGIQHQCRVRASSFGDKQASGKAEPDGAPLKWAQRWVERINIWHSELH